MQTVEVKVSLRHSQLLTGSGDKVPGCKSMLLGVNENFEIMKDLKNQRNEMNIVKVSLQRHWWKLYLPISL
jgi:hypothetical protein